MSTVISSVGWAALVRRVRGSDPVVLAIIALVLVLAALVPGQAGSSLLFTVGALFNILPYLLLSVVIAGAVTAMGLNGAVARVFAGNAGKAIVASALIGALTPFCSCGVIPIIAGLLMAGVPIAPVMAFWIASPLMNPQAFLLTAGVLDMDFAVARMLSAIALGLAAGWLTHLLVARGLFMAPLRAGLTACGSCCGSAAGTCGETEEPAVWRFWREGDRRLRFVAEAGGAGWFLLRWMTLAFLVESLMVAYLPAETVAAGLGGDSWWSIPAGVAAGVPAYLNSFAAIPMVAGLVDMGMAPGAALAFLTAGAVTSLPAAMSVFALVRPSLFGWYLTIGVVGSLAVGYGWQGWVTGV